MSNRLPDQKGEADGSESTRHKAENYKEQQRTTKNQAKELKNSTMECQGIELLRLPSRLSKIQELSFLVDTSGYPTSAPISILDPYSEELKSRFSLSVWKGLAGGKWEEQAE